MSRTPRPNAAFTTPRDAARRIWVQSASEAGTPRGTYAVAMELFARLRAGLGRWIGDNGYRMLLERALGVAREEHPWIGSLFSEGSNEAGISAAENTLGANEAIAGMVTLLATLIDLLGRIVGAEMAARLVEQAAAPAQRGVVRTETERNTDG